VRLRTLTIVALCVSAVASVRGAIAADAPRVGFTVHWDFFNSAAEAERLVRFAIANGAEILNVVPPAHIWEDPASVATLRRIFAITRAAGVEVALNRIDATMLPQADGSRPNWLYASVLTEPGRLPSGTPTPDLFLATVGKPDYERWLRDETAYYAEHFSAEPNLVAFGVGLFNEPFVSQRGSLLCFDEKTDSYEVAQYTPPAAALWHGWLARAFGGDLGALAERYGTRFARFDAVPMPRDETDPRFGRAGAAYFDFVAAIDDWVERQLDECRHLWHERRVRAVPFVLQLSGYEAEKFANGRAALAALDLPAWIGRADALGLSLYTNCDYPDWGHASDVATANLARVAALLGKPVFVLESGSECDGAVLRGAELSFLAETARPLAPRSFIYEFLKTTEFESFATSAGKLLGNDWRSRPAAVAAVRDAFAKVRTPAAPAPATYVLDDLEGAPGHGGFDPEALAARLALARLAMTRVLVPVPPSVLDRLPPDGTLVVVPRGEVAALRDLLRGRGIVVQSAAVFLAAHAAPPPDQR
jgi:hypothetical protein